MMHQSPEKDAYVHARDARQRLEQNMTTVLRHQINEEWWHKNIAQMQGAIFEAYRKEAVAAEELYFAQIRADTMKKTKFWRIFG